MLSQQSVFSLAPETRSPVLYMSIRGRCRTTKREITSSLRYESKDHLEHSRACSGSTNNLPRRRTAL